MHPVIQRLARQLFNNKQSATEKIEVAFHYVRDDIQHSWDIQNKVVTCSAADVAEVGHGICYAKSNLLSALLRSQGIPTGFCYQRLMLFDTPDKGYCLHALNAVYIAEEDRRIRLDARGNKPCVNAQFSLVKEQLAFSITIDLDEVEYKTIYAVPLEDTIQVLRSNVDALYMYRNRLPAAIIEEQSLPVRKKQRGKISEPFKFSNIRCEKSFEIY